MTGKNKSILSWKISKENLEEQVNKYDKLKVYQSFRGISALILSFGLIASTLVNFLLGMSNIEVLFLVFIQMVFVYFIYKGHRWAMTVVIIAFTINIVMYAFERGINGTFTTTSMFLISVVWLLIVGYLIKAIRVENHRRKKKRSEQSEIKKIKTRPKYHKWLSQYTIFTRFVLILIPIIVIYTFWHLYYQHTLTNNITFAQKKECEKSGRVIYKDFEKRYGIENVETPKYTYNRSLDTCIIYIQHYESHLEVLVYEVLDTFTRERLAHYFWYSGKYKNRKEQDVEEKEFKLLKQIYFSGNVPNDK